MIEGGLGGPVEQPQTRIAPTKPALDLASSVTLTLSRHQ